MAFRDRDINGGGGWTGAGDGTREERMYYAQNWRADVSAIFDGTGEIQEWDKYRAYGVPFLLTAGDHNKNGVIDKDDDDAFTEDFDDGVVSRADLDKDGDVDTDDETIFNAWYAKATPGGRFKLSASSLANRKGYAGYEHDGYIPELAHVRYRVLHFGLGRWTRRDPAGYVDGANLLECGRSSASWKDPLGLFANVDFVLWYYFARGATLDLGSVGLGQAYENHPAIRTKVADEVSRVRNIAKSKAEAMADSYRCDCFNGPQINQAELRGSRRIDVLRTDFVQDPPRGMNIYEENRWFWETDWTFSIGGHFLRSEFLCHVGVDCGYCADGSNCDIPRATHIHWWFSCNVVFKMTDTFSDPLDVLESLDQIRTSTGFGWLEGLYVIGILPHTPGHPFSIQYEFSRGFGGDGLKPKDHSPCLLPR